MMRVLMVLIAVGLMIQPAAAQASPPDPLSLRESGDLVPASGLAELCVAEECDLVKIEVPGYPAQRLQLKVNAEAPAGGVISGTTSSR